MKVMANSVPKSGTKLLLRLLTLLGFKESAFTLGADRIYGRFSPAKRLLRGPITEHDSLTIGAGILAEMSGKWVERRVSRIGDGEAFLAHCIYVPTLHNIMRRQEVSIIGIFRDPRDVALSQMYYLKQNKNHLLHEKYMALSSDHERLLFSIRGGQAGGQTLQSLGDMYSQFLKWEVEGDGLLVRFEDLVGERGGGTWAAQRKSIEQICSYLDFVVDERKVAFVQEDLFGSSSTFRKGQIGGWRSEFSEEHKVTVKEVAGTHLIELGYEEDMDW